MKYLFIVQGEGRGHLTQALALAQMLRRNGHEVPQVLVGKNPNRVLPAFFEEKIGCGVCTFDSPSFDYGRGGKKGNIAKTIIANTTPLRLARWARSISTIARCIEETQPDVVVNFYEILVGITALLHRLRVPVVSIGHQFLVDHPDYAHLSHTDQGQITLRLNNMLCSLGTTKTLALSFYPLKDFYRQRIAVVPPLLRGEVFELEPRDEGYILGYILNPAYADELRAWHTRHPEQKLHLFWDKKDAPDVLEVDDTLTIHRLNDSKFLSMMAECSGYATTAGFESVCEAMYLGKPAMMVPAHLEQEINAEDAAGVGAGIAVKTFDLSQLVDFIPRYTADTPGFRRWVGSAEELFVRHLTTLV
jgi:uncharacterized protein (TIGR00661 family)